MNLLPNERLLLALAAGAAADSPVRLAALIDAPGFDWRLYRPPGIGWTVAPFIYHQLSAAGLAGRLPTDLAEAMRALTRHTAVRNRLLLHHLTKIAEEAEAAGIPLLALKGADLMLSTYTDPALRIMRDLDLMVPRDQVTAAEALLRRLHFKPAVEMPPDWFRSHHHHGVTWRSEDGLAHVELHWALARPSDPFRLEEAALFARARPLGWSRRSAPDSASPELRVLGLAPLDQLEFLAVHFFRHLAAADWALHSIVDLAQVLHVEGWSCAADPRLIEAAQRHGTLLPLALAFELLEEGGLEDRLAAAAAALAAEVPPPQLRAGRALLAALFRSVAGAPPPIVSGLMGLGQAAGLSGKIHYLRESFFPPAAALPRDLPAAQRRWPAPFRRAAFLWKYAADLARTGPSAARAAYRLGCLRREMQRHLEPLDRARPPAP